MNWVYILVCLISWCIQAHHCIPLGEWDLAFFDEAKTQDRMANASSVKEFAQELGITEEFLYQLKENWEKAIEEEKQKGKVRQSGGIGDFFGLGGGGGGGGGNFGGGGGGGGGGGLGGNGPEDEEDEDEDAAAMPPGPGAAGILTGLFGIFSGVGSLNPKRVIQSTVNFFPPDQRVAAQMALDAAFGVHNVTTLAPLTDAPSRNRTSRPVPVLLSSANKTDTSVAPSSGVATTTMTSKVDNTTRRRFNLKETSLLQDFEEAAVKLSPSSDVISLDVANILDKPRLSALEKDFADTADTFKIVSVNVNDGKGSSQEAEQQIVQFAINATTIGVQPEISTVSPKPEIVDDEAPIIIVRVAE